MRVRVVRHSLAIAALATATIAVPAAPVGGLSWEPGTEIVGVWGDATGAWASVETPDGVFDAGPAPQVVLPPDGSGGGPFTDALASLVIGAPDPIPLAGALEVSTEGATGPGGFSASSASIADVNPTGDASLVVSADAVDVECRASLDGWVGSTTITGGTSLLPEDPTAIPEQPLPNTVVWSGVVEVPFGPGVLRGTGEVVVNEQYEDAGWVAVIGVRTSIVIEFVPEGGDPVILTDAQSVIGVASCAIDTGQGPPGPPGPTPPTPIAPVTVTPRFTG